MKLKFQIVTPERVVLSKEVDALTCPTEMGQITVLPNHIPLIASLMPGELIAKNDNQTEHIAVSGGFIEVRPGNDIVILADTAERSDEINAERAEQAKKRAEDAMQQASTLSKEEYAATEAALQRSLVRLKVAKKTHRGHHGSSEGMLNQ
ncbi:MAG: F0F1 ATP synthase subunit epsilon [Patescibacteria group bacterium]